jgi:ADP-ribose pyrophosphatase
MGTQKGPWIVNNSKTVYQNKWLWLREDDVIRPDGNKGTFSVVGIKPGISILPIDAEQNVYLTKEFHYAIEQETIEVVSGGIESDEPIEQAAKRELVEELGISANKLIPVGKINQFTSIVVSPNYQFIAQDLSFTSTNPEGTEKIAMVKIPFTTAYNWVLESQISDAITSILIMKAKTILQIQTE